MDNRNLLVTQLSPLRRKIVEAVVLKRNKQKRPMKVALQQNPEKVEQWLKVDYPAIKKRAQQEIKYF